MNREKLEAIIEGILFAMGDAVSMDKLSEVVGVEKEKLIEIVLNMEKKFDEDPKRGVRIIRLEDSFQLCTKTELYEYVRLFIERKGRNSLSNAALEVLSIVAYNQPVTRSTIEFIRGVNSDGSLAKLVELGLVDEVGRLDAPGRPVLFGTTEEFLRCFSISSLENLPEIDIMSGEEEMDEYEKEEYGTEENLDT